MTTLPPPSLADACRAAAARLALAWQAAGGAAAAGGAFGAADPLAGPLAERPDELSLLPALLDAVGAALPACLADAPPEARAAGGADRVVALAAAVGRASDYVAEAAIADADCARLVAEAALALPGATSHRQPADHARALEPVAALAEPAALHDAFCRWRRREHVRIALRDLAGLCDLENLMVELSRLAAAACALAQEVVGRRLVAQHGRPLVDPADETALPAPASPAGPGPRVARFATVALGKAGGYELNFSSDLDLVFVYEAEGETEGVPRPAEPRPVRVLSNHEFFNKLAREVVQFLSTHGAGGAPYRIDLRLRPEGGAGPIARSLESYRHYFATQAEGWERLAYAKARVVAGEPAFGAAVEEAFREFVFSEFFNTELLAEIAHLKARIDTEVAHGERSWRDVKRGVGGIRELEFVVGALQLLYAREHPRVEARRSTLWTIDALLDAGLLDVEAGGWMRDSYLLLRLVEQRLQLFRNRQTHELPPDGSDEERRLLAPLAALAGRTARAVLGPVRDRIHAAFEDLFAREQVPSTPTFPLLRELATEGADEAAVLRQLAAYRLGTPRALAALVGMRDGTVEVYRSRRGRQFFESIAPHLLRVAAQVPEPVEAVLRLGSFLERAKSTTTYFELLAEQPRALELLVRLFGSGQYLSGLLGSHPELIDLLLAPETLRAAAPVATQAGEAAGGDLVLDAEESQWRARFLRALAGAPNMRRRQRVLRRLVTQTVLQVGTRFVLGLDGWPATAARLTRLARASLHAAFEVLVAPPAGRDPAPPADPAARTWAILGAGKLAADQLNFLSDLDLILVSEAATPDEMQRHTAAATELIKLFSEVTSDGAAWPIDVKLRPMGRNAPLVVSRQDLARYIQRDMDAWEFLVYTRCRHVAGDEAVAAAALEAIAAAYRTLPPRRFGATGDSFVGSVRAMRDRLADSIRVGQGTIETKRRHGGLVDLEFACELAIASLLAEGGAAGALAFPALLGAGPVRRRLEEWLGPDDARSLRRHLVFLYRFEAAVRLLSARREDAVVATPEKIEALTHALGLARSGEPLRATLDAVARENFRLFEATCDAATAWFAARAAPPPPPADSP